MSCEFWELLAINKSMLVRMTINVSIFARKYDRIVTEMGDHLEVALNSTSQLRLAWNSSISFDTEAEGTRVLQYVAAHTINATKWVNDYSSREAIIDTGCCLPVEGGLLDDEMWPQEQIRQALVALFCVHNDADLEKIISVNGHFFQRLKDMKMQQQQLREEEEHEKRLLMETKKVVWHWSASWLCQYFQH